MTPFNVEIKDSQGNRIVRVKRGISLFLSNVEVFDGNEQKIGGFKQQLFSIGGKFKVFNAQEETSFDKLKRHDEKRLRTGLRHRKTNDHFKAIH